VPADRGRRVPSAPVSVEEFVVFEAPPALLPAIRLYDLRHMSAAMLLLVDVPAKVVSERLGHASIQLTLDTYSPCAPTMQERAAGVMGYGWRVRIGQQEPIRSDWSYKGHTAGLYGGQGADASEDRLITSGL